MKRKPAKIFYSTDTSSERVETASTVLDTAGTESRTAARKAATNCPLRIFRTSQQQQAYLLPNPSLPLWRILDISLIPNQPASSIDAVSKTVQQPTNVLSWTCSRWASNEGKEALNRRPQYKAASSQRYCCLEPVRTSRLSVHSCHKRHLFSC